MSAPLNQTDPRREALDFIWSQYRIWDNASVKRRDSLTLWRRLVLALGIVGALAATLSTQPFITGLTTGGGWTSKGLGILSAILLGLAAFFSQKVMSPKDEEQWVRARGAAEAFKREAYLLAASAPPYDAGVSLGPAKAINASLEDLEPLPLDPNEPAEAPPTYPMTVDDYIKSRVDQQTDWYNRRAGDHRGTLRLISGATFGLGALAVILGAISSDTTAPWVAVITTIIATLTAYLYAWRYQYMVVSYLATARRLTTRRADWKTSGKTDADKPERNQFILECEGILGAENKAWITELNRRDTTASATVSGESLAQLPNGGGPAAVPAGSTRAQGADVTGG